MRLDQLVPSGSRYRAGGLFAVAGVLFGGTFVAVEVGLRQLPPLLFLAFRFDIAAAVLLPYVYLRADVWRPRTRRDIGGIAAGTLAIGLTNALIFIGQQYLTSGVAAIIFSLAPVLTPGFALVLLSDEHLSLRGFGGLLLSLLGVGLVIRPNLAHLFAGSLTGRVILLAGAINIALGTVLIRRSDPTGNRISMSTNSSLTSSRMGPSGVISSAVSMPSENQLIRTTILPKPVPSVSLHCRTARVPSPRTRSHNCLLLMNLLLVISMCLSISLCLALSVGCMRQFGNLSIIMGAIVKNVLNSNSHSGVTAFSLLYNTHSTVTEMCCDR